MPIDPDNRSPHQVFEPAAEVIPPERSATVEVIRPSAERMPFGPSGVLKDEVGPLPEDFLDAPDIANLPWTRHRRDAWTTPALRSVVLFWLREWIAAHQPVRSWTVTEKATVSGSPRLLADECYLRINITKSLGGTVRSMEISVQIPVAARSSDTEVRRLLDLAGASLDRLFQ